MKSKRNLIILILSIMALLTMMIVIFVMSSQDASNSSASSGKVVDYVIDNFVKDYETYTEQEKITFRSMVSTLVRKSAHFTEFAILGLFSILHIKAVCLYKQVKIKLGYVYALAFSLLYATSDEIHQIFVDGRACQFTDILIDFFGSFLAIMIVNIIFFIIRKIDKETKANG